MTRDLERRFQRQGVVFANPLTPMAAPHAHGNHLADEDLAKLLAEEKIAGNHPSPP
jgi:hypothetical protein